MIQMLAIQDADRMLTHGSGYLAQVSSGYGHLKQLGNIRATGFLC